MQFARRFVRVLSLLCIAAGAPHVEVPADAQCHSRRAPLTQANASTSDDAKTVLAHLADPDLQETDPELLTEAIEKAGELRLAKAVNSLVSLLTFVRPDLPSPDGLVVLWHPLTDFDRYPAMRALYAIGEPSVAPLERLILDADTSSAVTDRALQILSELYRYRPKEGIDRLRVLKAQSPSVTTSNQIDATIRVFESLL